MTEEGNREVKHLYRTAKVIRGREASTIANWQHRGWELHTRDKGALRTTLTFRQVVTPSRFKPWMSAAALLAVGVLALGGVAIAEAIGDDEASSEARDTSSQPASPPTEGASDQPSQTPPEPRTEQPSESARPEPTVTESSQPQVNEVLTIEDSPDLKALLTSDEDYALSSTFARTYRGRTIAFDGSIASAAGSTYLAYAGDNSDTVFVPGPAFQFRGLQVDGGRANAGENLRFIAKVGAFKGAQGLFTLTSVSAEPR